MKAILLCSLLLFLFVDDDGYCLSEFLFEILLCEMEWCGVCVERWWCVLVDILGEREREREQYGWLFWAAEVFKKRKSRINE